MADIVPEQPGLSGDPKRQATDALRGYVYQIWHSVHAWLELDDNEFLVLEGAEDFDIVSPGSATVVQVKDTAPNITLRTTAVIEAITHFWQLRKAYPDRKICFRLLTRSRVGVERGHPFGSDIGGLELWQKCRRTTEHVDKLRTFLLSSKNLPEDLQKFLLDSSTDEILQELILPIMWETGSRDASYVEEAVVRVLILHGEKNGIPPSRAETVVNRLLKEALTTACQKDRRFLDRALFLRLFEEETTERVPIRELRSLRSAAHLATPMLASLLGYHAPLSFQTVAPIQTSIPPVHPEFSSRNHLVMEFRSVLREAGVIVLNGSAGMGKTTLAKLIANSQGGNWYWVNLSGHDPQQVSAFLHLFAIKAAQIRTPVSVVLDDINLSPLQARYHEDFLGALIYTFQERDGEVIITSQKPLPSRLIHRLNFDSRSIKSVPPFDEDEAFGLATQLGCPEEGIARNWAKVVLLQTRGHPQLVHARLKQLAYRGWPPFNVQDLLVTPPELVRERSETREMLIEHLPAEQREFVYRLSIISGPFRHDHAVAIGENSPPVAYPGDAFEQLLGPWVERIGGEYYRISPLLENAAKEVWSNKRIQSLHEIIAHEILQCDKLTTIEARAIFFHAFMGRSIFTLVALINGLLTAPEDVWKTLASDLSWFICFGLKPQQPLFPEDNLANFMLRALQFRIAAEIEPEEAPNIVIAWDNEIDRDQNHKLFLGQRLIMISQVLLHYQVKMLPRQLLSYLVEMAEIQEQLEQVEELEGLFKGLKRSRWVFNATGTADPVTILFSFVFPRCSDFQFLDALLEALKESPVAVRVRMLSSLKICEGDARLLIDRVWMNEADSIDPDWPGCVRVFQKAIEFAIQWDIPELMSAAARGIAIIYDEYLHDSMQALAVLDEIEKRTGSSVTLREERATVLFDHERYGDALDIWEELLPGWSPPVEHADTLPIFACRKAGIAAALTGDLKKAAKFFKEGSQRACALNQMAFSTGFLADAGFALWKAGEYFESVGVFENSLRTLEELPDPEKDLRSFTVGKLVGHTLMWIDQTLTGTIAVDLVEPPLGMCSNPDRNEKIRELPVTPLDFSWLHLALIEHRLNTGSRVLEYVRERFEDSRFLLVRFLLAYLEVMHAFRQADFAHLPSLSLLLTRTFHAGRNHMGQDKRPWELIVDENILEAILPDEPIPGLDMFFAALTVLAAIGKLDSTIFHAWRNDAEALPISDVLLSWIQIAEAIFSQDVRKVRSTMMDANESRERRLLAALRIGMSETVAPGDLFYAHTLLVSDLLQGVWAKQVADQLADLISRQWLVRIQFPAVFVAPRATIPEIHAAITSETHGAEKAAKILLAASNAISLRLPMSLVQVLQDLAAGRKLQGPFKS